MVHEMVTFSVFAASCALGPSTFKLILSMSLMAVGMLGRTMIFFCSRYNYHTASRTLCPFLHSYVKINGSGTDSFSVDVSTSSPQPVNYTLKAEFVHNFEIRWVIFIDVVVGQLIITFFHYPCPSRVICF